MSLDVEPGWLEQQASCIEAHAVAEFRAAGGKVVGYSCVSTPRELLDAAGLLPYCIRAMGNNARELADARMSRFNCSYCRSCLQLGLDGHYDFLDGLVQTNGCDHLRGMFENWHDSQPDPDWFFHYLPVPHLINPDTLAVFVEELGLLREALRQQFRVQLSDDDLRCAMARQTAIRGKLLGLRQLRERAAPTLTGSEALALSLLETAWPPEPFEALLDRLLATRGALPRGRRTGPLRSRVLLAGSATDELVLVLEIERLGAVVVADALCHGTRASWRIDPPPPEVTDPLATLAHQYLHHLLCPRMFDDYPRRQRFITDAVQRAAVDGVILLHNKFCDLHGVENVRLRIDLEQRGIPVLVLEKEYGASADLGRIGTRVQAFLERLDVDRPKDGKHAAPA